MLKPSGGFMKKVFGAPGKVAGAIGGGAKAAAGAMGMKKKSAADGPPKGVFGKAIMNGKRK